MKEWETSEVLFVMNNAGFMTLSDIAEGCGHDLEEVEGLLGSLGISGVLLVPPVRLCPSCGAMRQTAVNKSGVCRVCKSKDKLHTVESRFQDLLAEAPPEIKELYDGTEANRMSRVPPKPVRPNIPKHATITQRKVAQAAYEAAIEEWEVLTYHRQYRSAQKRLERLRKMLDETDNGQANERRDERGNE